MPKNVQAFVDKYGGIGSKEQDAAFWKEFRKAANAYANVQVTRICDLEHALAEARTVLKIIEQAHHSALYREGELKRERDEARAEMIRWMSIAEGRGRTDDEPDTQAELAEAYAKLDRILKLTIHDDIFWAIEEIARISGGESDCSVCGGCFMILGSE